MKSAKDKIKTIVAQYIRIRRTDYINVTQVLAEKRKMTHDKFARLEGSQMSRGLFEIPEELHFMIVKGLDAEELHWFKSGISSNPNQGGGWFATAFPMFALAEVI